MRRLIFSLMTVVGHIVGTAQVSADTTAAWPARLERYDRAWTALSPDAWRAQVAGNMGAVSTGPVWIYGRNRQWETALTFGFVPKHQAANVMVTMTLKEDFVPWTIRTSSLQWEFQPLAAGLYLNTVFSNKFWTHQPDRYPKGYYWFSTRVRSNLYVGQRCAFNIPDKRRKFAHRIALFYELSTCDLYLIQCVKNDYITPGKILALSFGLQFEWE